MLVLHPNSQCDVCLDFYTANREPHVISCGHVFCYRCLQSLLQTSCPLCRMTFKPNDVRRLHVDKATLPPDTPQSYPPDLETTDRARLFQTQLTRIIRGGATASDLYDVQSELKPWLSTQSPDDHADLRATYTLLYRFTQGKARLEEVEQTCSNLEAALKEEKAAREEERLVAAAKYDELEKRAFEERELLLGAEKALKDESARLQEECEDLRVKLDACAAECGRLSDELKGLKGNPLPPLPRFIEPRHFYLHDLSGAKAETVAILKDSPDSASAVKVQIVGKGDFFQLSPVPPTQPIPDLPSNLMTFQPLTDDLDEPVDDDRSQRSGRVSVPRAIPNQAKSESRRSRTNSSGTHSSDSDAMSISVPRNTIDVHMASISSSPAVQYTLRPVEFVSNSVGRVAENALGLRTAEPVTMSPSPLSPEMKEHEERLAQLRDVLQDPMSSPAASLSRKSTLSGGGSDRARPIVPGGMSSTRTPSPVSSTSHSYSASSFEKEYGLPSHKHQLLQPPLQSGAAISCASRAALEHQQRTRASSTASSTAAPISSTLTHGTPTRDPTPPMHAIYVPAPPPASSPVRSTQSRRQSTDTMSISKGKASTMGLAPAGSYPSALTRSIRAMQEIPRVS